jgi:hypothetical protein
VTTPLFTLDEARSAMPLVQRIAKDIQTAVRDLSRINGAIAVFMGAMTMDEIAVESRDHAQGLLDKIRLLAAELTEIGAELKGVDPVLVDFRSFRNGRIVYLCWELGEPDINHWHTLEGGYQTRQEL